MTVLSNIAAAEHAIPVDHDWLCGQIGAGTGDPLAHYLEAGLAERLTPTRWFQTDWYAWQNPDWSKHHAAPYLHYLAEGRFQGRDPSPFVDMVRFGQMAGEGVPPERYYDLILTGHRSVALGVHDGAASLRACQRRFFHGIELLAHRLAGPTGRRSLVVLQAGRGALCDSWFDDEARDWDLWVNYYDAVGFRPGFGDLVTFQKGTKFSAMHLLWDRFSDVFCRYDHVLFLDDDIATSCSALNALFAGCREFDLDLAQMTLTSESACNWSELFSRPECTGPRPVSAVEIMMPVFSRRAMGWLAPTFGQSVSGFGLDLVWGKLVADKGGRIAVLDEVEATHARPVDQGGGAYYSYLRANMINAKAELWDLVTSYGADVELVGVGCQRSGAVT